MEHRISASILNANLLSLGSVVHELESAGADMLHFDVMDGLFVNNISFGLPVLSAISAATEMFQDVHLMINDPLKYVKAFADAGADLITFHYESDSDPAATIAAIRETGCKVGMSIKPGTPAQVLAPYIHDLDLVLIMTVEPGFGGQGYIMEMNEKIAQTRRMIKDTGREIMLEVDGGINSETAAIAAAAGADLFVVGSYLFREGSPEKAVADLRHALKGAVKS